MKKISLNVEAGFIIHFWVKSNQQITSPFFSIFSKNREEELCFRVQNVPQYYQFYSYQHLDKESIELEIDLKHYEVSLMYSFEPQTVEEQGVTFWEYSAEKKEIEFKSDLEIKHQHRTDKLRPKLHFSPYKGWMNDPNGLCFYQGKYHLFYQYHPHSLDWGPMHWGHAVSEDMVNWRHLPVFLHPEQNLESLGATGGAFSGSAYYDPKQDALNFFYTERKPAYHLMHSYREIQKRVEWDKYHVAPLNSHTILDQQPSFVKHDFRDPKVWFDPKDNLYKMILGSAIESTPAILLYQSQDKEHWMYHSTLYQTPNYFEENEGRCIECPDFIQFGDIWVIVFGVVGYHDKPSGRHNFLYAIVGRFEDNQFTPIRELQCLDFGTDFYAMQSFHDGNRHIALAWLHNWASTGHIHPDYNGEMSVPRELTLSENMDLLMNPVAEIKAQFTTGEKIQALRISLEENHQFTFALDLKVKNTPFSIDFLSDSTRIELCYDGKSLQMIEHNLLGEKMDYEWRSSTQAAKFSSLVDEFDDLYVLFDQGIVEVFANKGKICGTRRYIHTLYCHTISLSNDLSSGTLYFLKSQGE